MGFPYLFVIARDKTVGDISRIAMHLRDWEYGGGKDDSFLLRLRQDAISLPDWPEELPIREYNDVMNEFAGWTLEQLEQFMYVSRDELADGVDDFVVADEQTFKDMSVVFMEQDTQEKEKTRSSERFIKVRVPAVSASNMYASISTGNMGWEAYLGCGYDYMADDSDDAEPEPGWHQRIGIDASGGHWRRNVKQAEEALQEMDPDDTGEDVDLIVSRYCRASKEAEEEEKALLGNGVHPHRHDQDCGHATETEAV